MPSDFPLRCRCGHVRGIAGEVSPSTGFRFVCYCTDCQAFTRFLDRADVLDGAGGTDIFQLPPGRVKLTAGAGALRCVNFAESSNVPPPDRSPRARRRRHRSGCTYGVDQRFSAGGGAGSPGRTRSSTIIPARRSPRRAPSPPASARRFEWRNAQSRLLSAVFRSCFSAQSAFHHPWKLSGK
jgi:hypothetical protein